MDALHSQNPRLESYVDPETGAVHMIHPDGSMTIDYDAGRDDATPGDDDDDGDENIAVSLSETILSRVSADLIDGIEADDDSRQRWLTNVKDGLVELGLNLEKASTDAGTEGISRIRHPIMLEAVLRSWATAEAEALPSSGPVKAAVDVDDQSVRGIPNGPDKLAESLEKAFNHYLTQVETSYGPETSQLLLYRAFCGIGFKKVYDSPLRDRPVSEVVDPQHMIIANSASSLATAERVTQVITMSQDVVRRMQIVGVYRDIELGDPDQQSLNPVDDKISRIEGQQPSSRTEDAEHTIYECYCWLDIPGFEHKWKGKASGLKMPYRVSIDVTSSKILEIRSNADPDHKGPLPAAREVFVDFPYVPGFGYWPIGLLHILGNTTMAVTAAWRMMLDAGSFANFPAFMFMRTSQKQRHNSFRVGPGGGVPIDGQVGQRISDIVQAMPYKEPSQGLMALVNNIVQTGQRVGGAAEIQVGEGKQDAPVGTTLALIEQATKVEAASHKNLHRSLSKEFSLLKKLFAANPEALTRDNPKASQTLTSQLADALANVNIVPCSDPNTPSHLHRMMKIALIKQNAMANPALYDQKAVDTLEYEWLGLDTGTIGSLFAPPQPPQAPPVNPVAMASAQAKIADIADKDKQRAFDAWKTAQTLADKQRDRESKENLEVLRMANEAEIHPDGVGAADDILDHDDHNAAASGWLPQLQQPLQYPRPQTAPLPPQLPPRTLQ